MKTISLDHPVRVSFKDGECYHDSATILISNGFPSLVRARGPDVIYPWENIKHILRLADEAPPESDLIDHLHASVAAVADERNGAKHEVAQLRRLHTEHRLALRAALGLRDDEATDNVTGDFEALCERVRFLKRDDAATRDALEKSVAHHADRLAQMRFDLSRSLGLKDAELDHWELCDRVASLRSNYLSAYRIAHLNADDAHRLSNDTANLKADLASVTEQRDVLKRQLEGLRAEMRKPAKPDGTVLFPTLEQQATSFRENNPPDAERQQAQNRDQWRATCLANGAKDCTVYFGPGDEVTFVVEMEAGHDMNDVRRGLANNHGLAYDEYTIREVRPFGHGIMATTTNHAT